MCPNMNHFDAVDFSECHSEEVVTILTLSLYIMQPFYPCLIIKTKIHIKIFLYILFWPGVLIDYHYKLIVYSYDSCILQV